MEKRGRDRILSTLQKPPVYSSNSILLPPLPPHKVTTSLHMIPHSCFFTIPNINTSMPKPRVKSDPPKQYSPKAKNSLQMSIYDQFDREH